MLVLLTTDFKNSFLTSNLEFSTVQARTYILQDCESMNSSLHKTKQVKTHDKAMRQALWRGLDGKRVDLRILDYKPIDTTDRCGWVDTHWMLASNAM